MEELKERLEVLKALKAENTILIERYIDELKKAMIERGFTELLLLPLDCDGKHLYQNNELRDEDYLKKITCGWRPKWDGIRIGGSTVITRLAIIGGELFYRTALVNFKLYDAGFKDPGSAIFVEEDRKSSWSKLLDMEFLSYYVRDIVSYCFKNKFPWKFTETHPGSRLAKFHIDLEDYIGKMAKEGNLNLAFAGLEEITSLDLKPFAKKPRKRDWYCYAIFKNCKSLQAIDLSGIDFSKCVSLYEAFKNCESLEKIILHGCNPATIENISEEIANTETPLSVTLVCDDGDKVVTSQSSVYE